MWAQTTESATVHFEYWEKGDPKNKKKTDPIVTSKSAAYTAKAKADDVLPGKHYEYALFINGKEIKRPYELSFQTQKLWQWREDPPKFTFAFSSCAYVNEERFDRPGDPYGGGYEIFGHIADTKPDFMIWGGDNMYLREPDWNSETGIMHRYTHTRSLPEMQALLASTHHYAIWDDHDFGPNNSDRSFWNKHLTEKAFKNFWGNPNYGVANGKGITGTFQWADVQFFLLDNRYFRTPNNRTTGERHIIGMDQEEWLIDALKNSFAPFKFVVIGGQFLNPVAGFENHATFNEERMRILEKIRAEKIGGVIFLTGDRHHTVLSKYEANDRVPPIYDFTISSLTAGSHSSDENNYFKVEGTMVGERNFSIMEVSGERKNRTLSVKVINGKGKLLWEKSISAKELQYSR